MLCKLIYSFACNFWIVDLIVFRLRISVVVALFLPNDSCREVFNRIRQVIADCKGAELLLYVCAAMAPKRKAPAAATTEENEGIPELKKRGDRAEAAAASAPLESEHEDAGPFHEKGSPAEKKGTEKEEDGEEEGSEDEQMTASKGETAAEKASEEAGSGAEDEVEKATPSTKSPGKRTTTPGKDAKNAELEEEDENEAEEETAAPEVEIPAKKKGTATRSAKKETVKVDNADEDLDEEMERAPDPDVKPAGATNGVDKSVERWYVFAFLLCVLVSYLFVRVVSLFD